MGLLDKILGNASEVDSADVSEELAPILAANEQIHKVYKLIRDLYVFTDKRLLLIDKQGLTGKKVDYHTIPYRAITQFKVETTGHFDMDAELKIWVSGQSEPIEKELSSDCACGIQRTLADCLFS